MKNGEVIEDLSSILNNPRHISIQFDGSLSEWLSSIYAIQKGVYTILSYSNEKWWPTEVIMPYNSYKLVMETPSHALDEFTRRGKALSLKWSSQLSDQMVFYDPDVDIKSYPLTVCILSSTVIDQLSSDGQR